MSGSRGRGAAISTAANRRARHYEVAISMPDRPGPLALVDSHLAAARIAHEYVFDLHRELVELDAANDHTRELMRESAAVALERMPALTRRLRGLEREWSEQELLDPRAAERTVEHLNKDVAALLPALASLRTRQNQIVADLLDRITRAR